jgi:hypothetical protein
MFSAGSAPRVGERLKPAIEVSGKACGEIAIAREPNHSTAEAASRPYSQSA